MLNIQRRKLTEWADHDLQTNILLVTICLTLVLLSGLFSGLTLGLMSLDTLDMEVLLRSGSPSEQRQAKKILPIISNEHFLLVTLLMCNACTMEALPIFLDALASPVTAVLLSVTAVLFFGEIIPQSICSRFGLAIGAHCAPFVRALMMICSPVAWPLGKIIDFLLGSEHHVLYRRRQLKELVQVHAEEEGLGGKLTKEETDIITGALDLTNKVALKSMTPLHKVFMISTDDVLDTPTLVRILASGHSRVPVHRANDRKDVVGIILVKELLQYRLCGQDVPVSMIRLRSIPRLSGAIPMYDLLRLFQTGRTHIAMLTQPSDSELEKIGLLPPPPSLLAESGVLEGGGDVDVDVHVRGGGRGEGGGGGGGRGEKEHKGEREDLEEEEKEENSEEKEEEKEEEEKREQEKELLEKSEEEIERQRKIANKQKSTTKNGDGENEGKLTSEETWQSKKMVVTVSSASSPSLLLLAPSASSPSPITSSPSPIASSPSSITSSSLPPASPLPALSSPPAEAISQNHPPSPPPLRRPLQGEPIGLITLEDVIEELIRKELVDETDRYVDNEKRHRVTDAIRRIQGVGVNDALRLILPGIGGGGRGERGGDKGGERGMFSFGLGGLVNGFGGGGKDGAKETGARETGSNKSMVRGLGSTDLGSISNLSGTSWVTNASGSIHGGGGGREGREGGEGREGRGERMGGYDNLKTPLIAGYNEYGFL